MPKIISTKETEKHNNEEVNDMFDSLSKPEEVVDETEEQEENIIEDETEEQETTETTEVEETEDDTEGGEDETEDSTDEPEPEDEVNEKLRQRIAELETGQAFKGPESEEEEQEEPVKKTKQKVDQVMDFVTDEEFEEIQSDPKKLNSVLARVYQRARQDTIRDIPELIQQTTQRQVTLQDAVKGFYEKSPDLRPHAPYVGFVASQVRAENPDLQINEVLQKTEERVRENLAISKSAKAQEEHRRKGKKGKDAPAFAKKGSGNHKGGKTDDRSGFAKQVDQMLETVNR